MASSIDGFVARSNGSVDWIDTEVDLGDDYSSKSFLQRVDSIIMGRKSYEQVVSFGQWPYPNHHTLVFSKSRIEPKTPNITIGVCSRNGKYRTLSPGGGIEVMLA